jgi:hypothetical protein
MREQMNPSLGDALRALPQQAPDGDVWSQLAAEIAPARTRRNAWPFFAAAAAVLIAIAAMLILPHHPPATDAHVATSNDTSANTNGNANVATTATDTSNHAQLIALQSRSRELEQWLHQTAGAAAPLPGSDLAAAMEIENLIGVVDLQLAAPDQNDGGRDEEKLWHRRVNLLEDLTALRYSNYRLAESDGRPTTWIN